MSLFCLKQAQVFLIVALTLCVPPQSFAMLEGIFLYFPSHSKEKSNLKDWVVEEKIIGFCRISDSPKTVWLVFHGNAGQAGNRGYIADCLPQGDSVYVMEYPGYGHRNGTPSMHSINSAAVEAYTTLKASYPSHRIGVLGESLGSGPASYLCSLEDPPGRIVLIVPFDTLLALAKDHFQFLPVSLLLRDKWDNITTLAKYSGRVDIFGASQDEVIPVHHARNLASMIPSARFHEMRCGHNDWSSRNLIKIED
jgi:uncharacterized protein